MKKILYIIGGMDQGGAESFVMNVLRNINHKKYKFVIATFLDPRNGKNYVYADELKRMGVKIIKLNDTRFTRPWNFAKQVRQLCIKEKPDIIHSHIDFMSALPLLGAKHAGVKQRIAHSHNTFNAKLDNPLGRVFLFLYRHIILDVATKRLACGRAAGRFLYGPRRKFEIIPNGVKLKDFYFKPQARRQLRQEFGLSPNDKVVLNVGRFEKQKNHFFLLDVMNLLDEDFKLVLVGDGSFRAELEEKVKLYGLDKRVIFTGMRKDVYHFYSLADYFVLPSHFEGFPTVCVEARASGLPCFLSDRISKEVNVLGDIEFVRINPAVSPTSWATTINESIPTPSAERIAMRRDATIREFDIKNTVKLLEVAYDSR